MQAVLQGEKASRPPVWLMRQAGRYLPEYKATRQQAGNFLNLCYTPELACEVTLQPIRRFNMDAAILFSDILVIPHALGLQVGFVTGDGPKVEAVQTANDVEKLAQRMADVDQTLAPIYESVRLIKAALPVKKDLIGFCGAPWTVALYMLGDKATKDGAPGRVLFYTNRAVFDRLIQVLVDTSIHYLTQQIKAGANIIQIFDSWAGHVTPDMFEAAVQQPLLAICAGIKKEFPDVPVVLFPRGVTLTQMQQLAKAGQGMFEGLSVDYTTPLYDACTTLQPYVTVQGNLDPALLLADKQQLVAAVRHMLAQGMATRPQEKTTQKGYIANLGHGIMPATPPENVAALVVEVMNFSN